MPRLIDADKLLEKQFFSLDDDGYGMMVVSVTDIISAPTVERKRGRMDYHEPDKQGNRKPKCSVCGKYKLAYWSDYIHCKYCPNCGADMRGDGDG